MYIDELMDLHSKCTNNRSDLKFSLKCGCFSCLHTFQSKEIKDWIDNKTTAICPYCGVDSVISYEEDFKEKLEILHRYYIGE